MFGCDIHLLKHMKQAILVWSFRQNIFLGCYPEKTSKIGRAVDIVCATHDHQQSKVSFKIEPEEDFYLLQYLPMWRIARVSKLQIYRSVEKQV